MGDLIGVQIFKNSALAELPPQHEDWQATAAILWLNGPTGFKTFRVPLYELS